jgi:hypothetical protein
VLLFVVMADAFKFSFWKTSLLLIAYSACASEDQKRKDEDFEKQTFGWKPDADQPEYETQGNLSRVKLTGQNQIIVTRVGEMLRRTP